jgi:hypothetical protein
MIELLYIPRFVTGGLVDSHALLYRIFVYCIHYGSHVSKRATEPLYPDRVEMS